MLLECNRIALFLMFDRALPESILEAAPESVTKSILRNMFFYICLQQGPALPAVVAHQHSFGTRPGRCVVAHGPARADGLRPLHF